MINSESRVKIQLVEIIIRVLAQSYPEFHAHHEFGHSFGPDRPRLGSEVQKRSMQPGKKEET